MDWLGESSSPSSVSTIKRNEQNSISVNDLNTNACHIKFNSTRAKDISLEITNKLGVSGDYVKTEITNIAAKANGSIELNIRQGFAGLELVNKGARGNLPIKLSGKIQGKKIAKNFTLPFKEAMRIKTSSAVSSSALMASEIDKLFGTVKQSHVVRKAR